jgi:hypothetical protein
VILEFTFSAPFLLTAKMLLLFLGFGESSPEDGAPKIGAGRDSRLVDATIRQTPNG